MNDPSTTFMKCPACGAINRVGADATCWVCEQPLNESRAVHVIFDDDQTPPETGHSRQTMIVTTAVLVLGFSLMFVAPGLGIMLLILSIIPLIRMRMLLRPQDDSGKAVSLYLGSLLTSVVIVTVVGITAFGSFCLSLFGVCALAPRGGDSMLLIIVYGITALSVIAVCIPIWGWISRRWKRDKNEYDD